MNRNSILLIFPPGWSLDVGGPHIALPLLKGFLESRSVPVQTLDLNIALSRYYGVQITASNVINACQKPTPSNLNYPYFNVQEKLNSVASRFGGQWDLQKGFGCFEHDPASPESVRLFSEKASPFTQYYCSEVVPFVLENMPSIIGFSVTVPGQLLSTFELCRLLRKSGYGGKIILGGNVITRLGDNILLDWVYEIVDGVVFFQGEYALLELWKAIETGKTLDGVPNLSWKKSRQIDSNRTRILDAFDFEGPNFSDLPLDYYWGISYLPMIGTRGCYYNKCTFCAIPYGWGNSAFIGHSDPKDVFENMKRSFYLHAINRFKFVEEALHPNFIKHLVDLINLESFECYFEGYARFDPFWCDSNFLNRASTAGLKKLYLGLEISPSESRSTLKKSDSAGIVETLIKLNESGIKAHVFCMFGYPGTGIEEAFSTIEFVLKHSNLIDSLDIFPFYYAKHTKVDLIQPVIDPTKNWALEYNYIPETRGVLSSNQVIELSKQLEELIWKEHPVWLHPIYRMYSPWQESLHAAQHVMHSRYYVEF